MRHGETDYNNQSIMQGGGVDSNLNEAGLQQSRLFHDHYRDTPFTAIYTSGLKRTLQTIQPFVRPGLRPMPLLELNEMSWGVLEGQPRTDEVERLLQQALTTWTGGNTYFAVRGGESPEQVWERAHSGIRHIMQKHTGGGNVLICTHGRTLRILLSQMLGYGLAHMQRFAHANTGLNILRVSGNRFIPELLNDTRHLTTVPA
ncbi:MAG: histidine phosphatase family protein [Bacteroidetes bacterium]|nr:histidine phosphatase family protein [Bacteroidota bacterium]